MRGTQPLRLWGPRQDATSCRPALAGTGASYQGRPFINPGGTSPIYFGNPGQVPSTGELTRSGVSLAPDTPINILGPDGFPVRNDNTSWPAYVGRGDGTSPAEQYCAYDPVSPSSAAPLPPGSSAILKNKATGLYCRCGIGGGGCAGRCRTAGGRAGDPSRAESRQSSTRCAVQAGADRAVQGGCGLCGRPGGAGRHITCGIQSQVAAPAPVWLGSGHQGPQGPASGSHGRPGARSSRAPISQARPVTITHTHLCLAVQGRHQPAVAAACIQAGCALAPNRHHSSRGQVI
jgi:hypothetical protein